VESHVNQRALDGKARDYKYSQFRLAAVLRSRLYPEGMNYVYMDRDSPVFLGNR